MTEDQIRFAIQVAICAAWARGYSEGRRRGYNQPTIKQMDAIMAAAVETATTVRRAERVES